jgi:hypothetical protein
MHATWGQAWILITAAFLGVGTGCGSEGDSGATDSSIDRPRVLVTQDGTRLAPEDVGLTNEDLNACFRGRGLAQAEADGDQAAIETIYRQAGEQFIEEHHDTIEAYFSRTGDIIRRIEDADQP